MDTYTMQLGDCQLTIAALSPRHFFRTQTLPIIGIPPAIPEGYTHDQAIENVASYREEYERHDSRGRYQAASRAIGAARMEYAKTEHGRMEGGLLDAFCLRYSFRHPDEQTDPLVVGSLIYDIADETGNGTIPTEAYLWLQEKSGGVDPAIIQEALKSLRGYGERNAAGESSGNS